MEILPLPAVFLTKWPYDYSDGLVESIPDLGSKALGPRSGP